MADKSHEQVGIAVCSLHEFIQGINDRDRYNHAIDVASDIFKKWLIHPTGRNWNLISKFNEIMADGITND